MISPQAWFTNNFWVNVIGTIVLALAMAFVTVKNPDSQKPITAENFIGGFILGVLTGMFSDVIIQKLRDLLQ